MDRVIVVSEPLEPWVLELFRSQVDDEELRWCFIFDFDMEES